MLSVSQGCVSKILRRSRNTGHISVEAWKSEESEHSLRRQAVDPNGEGQSFHPGTSSARGNYPLISGEFANLEHCNRHLAASYQFRRPARCALDHRRRRRVRRRIVRRLYLRHWRQCVFSDECRFMLFHSDDHACVHRRQGERLIDVCINPQPPMVHQTSMCPSAMDSSKSRHEPH